MKFVILIEDYNLFYTRHLDSDRSLDSLDYDEKLKHLLQEKYYQSDSLAKALSACGHEAEIIIPECNSLQLSWASKNSVIQYVKWYLQVPLRSFKARILRDYYAFSQMRDEILLEQIKHMKPDVVFVYSNIWLGKKTIRRIKGLSKKVILQWSCPIEGRWKGFFFDEFDFIVSSSMSIVNYFKEKKIKCSYLQQAFDADMSVANNIPPKNDVVFIGNFTPYHSYRFEVIEYLLKNNVSIDVFGSGKETLPDGSLLKEKIMDPLTGEEMFLKYREYKMALHIYGAGIDNNGIDWVSFAGAKRIFEVTGIGTALITSYQDNLNELFSDGEIITFKTKEECLQRINYYLSKPEELHSVALSGQKRTLADHTFKNRAKSLLELIKL